MKNIYTVFKKTLLLIALSVFSNQLFAQTPNGIFPQAVASDNFTNPDKDRKMLEHNTSLIIAFSLAILLSNMIYQSVRSF